MCFFFMWDFGCAPYCSLRICLKISFWWVVLPNKKQNYKDLFSSSNRKNLFQTFFLFLEILFAHSLNI